jgi:hypothetical protein
MIDSIALSQSLAGLWEVGPSEAFDWDTSALADWPNIVSTQAASADPALASAESLPAALHQAC